MTPVLLLNASYEPLSVVPAKRAVVLILNGKAEPLHDVEGVLFRSTSLALALPSVIRLARYVAIPYRRSAPLTREGVFRRDHSRCAYCGKHATTLDHVIPRSRGGEHSWENLVACCRRCNHMKANLLLSELGWRLTATPHAPGAREAMLHRIDDPHPTWLTYLPAAA